MKSSVCESKLTNRDQQDIYREWIKNICSSYNVTATEIARRIGVSPSTITRQVKLGWTKSPQLKTLRSISSSFGVPVPQELVSNQMKAENVGPEVQEIQSTTIGTLPNVIIQVRVERNVLTSAGCIIGDKLTFESAISPMSGDIVLAEVLGYGTNATNKIIRILLPPYLVAAEVGRPTIRPMEYNPLDVKVRVLGTMTKRTGERIV
jgi:transcriptional regulator with XRE-family HTH domain